MKKLLAVFVLMSFSVAHADIRRPPSHEEAGETKRGKIEGVAATALYESIPGKELQGSQLRMGSSTYKILRAKDGMDQIVCEKWSSRGSASVSCTTESSADGKEVKEFVVPMRLG